MSSPFSNSSVIGQPSWSAVSANAGGFSPVSITGGVSIPEVGYDEGGYGQGGYDAPAINIPAASAPNWVTVVTK